MNSGLAIRIPFCNRVASARHHGRQKTFRLVQPMNETRTSLLMRVRNLGDQASWREFHDLYHPLLISFVRSKGIQDSNTAEDVVQDILVGLARRLPELQFDKSRGNFRTYLWQIANNAVATWYRKNARFQKSHDAAFDSRMQALEYETQTDPDAEFVTALRQRVLQQALKKLREEIRDDMWVRFTMHYLQKVPAADVAQRCGCSEGALYTSVSRILERLRSICSDYMEEFDL